MSEKTGVVLGSRGSDLALAQTRLVEQAIMAVRPDCAVERQIIRTSGDEGARGTLPTTSGARGGRKGLFTAEIEQRLLDRWVDIAVHSAKDLPSDMPAGLEIGGVLPRGWTEDILVGKCAGGLGALPPSAVIGSASVRRQHQLRRVRADLRVREMRGNVPTRLRKLRDDPACAAIILARAGLARLGLESDGGTIDFDGYTFQAEILGAERFLHAGGQGVIALQIRAGDDHALALTAAVNDHDTFLCLRAEREFLRLLQGDCDSPVGVAARRTEGVLELRAEVFEEGSVTPRVGDLSGSPDDPEDLAAKLMEQMYGK